MNTYSQFVPTEQQAYKEWYRNLQKIIYHHSWNCDCVLVQDPCLVAKYDGQMGVITATVHGAEFHVMFVDGMTVMSIDILDLELVKIIPVV